MIRAISKLNDFSETPYMEMKKTQDFQRIILFGGNIYQH